MAGALREELRGEHPGWCWETNPTVLRVAEWLACELAKLRGCGTSAGTWPLAERQEMLAEWEGEKAVMSPMRVYSRN